MINAYNVFFQFMRFASNEFYPFIFSAKIQTPKRHQDNIDLILFELECFMTLKWQNGFRQIQKKPKASCTCKEQ